MSLPLVVAFLVVAFLVVAFLVVAFLVAQRRIIAGITGGALK